MNNFYIAADMQRIATSPNASALYSSWSGYICDLGGKANIGTGKTTFYINEAQTTLGVSNTDRKLISGTLHQSSGQSVGTLDVYADTTKIGELQTNVDITTTTNYDPGLRNIIGGKPDSTDTTEIFDGNCWFFACGFIDHSKRELADSIFKTFLDAVKPRS